jgi:1-acyl-sn-glycerol-3-phosphate acyltransferase
MTDERRTIGTSGAAGRGNRSTPPSAAARALAGGQAQSKRPVKKANANAATVTPAKPTKKAGPKTGSKAGPKAGPKPAANAAKPAAKKASAAASKVTPVASAKTTQSTGATKRPAAKSGPRSAAGLGATPGGKPRKKAAPHLRAVTDADAAEAAAAAAMASEPSGSLIPGVIPLDEIVVAIIQAAQRVLGSEWESRLATFVAALRRRLSGDFEVDEFGFDAQISEVLSSAIEPLAEKWFRLEVRGVENIPADGGALLVANHSGTIPIDAIVTSYAVHRYSGRNLRPLGADLVFALPFVGQIARKVGATLACTADAERLLTTGELAGVWPEGFKGIGKPYAERYKLQRFGRGGFVSSAMRAGVPIVPVSIVGAEEIYPLVGNVPSLARLLGLPYLPITPFFPLLGPLGLIPLPSKWIIEFGEPVRTDAYEPEAADDPMLLFNVTDQVRETIQQTLYKLLVERGSAFF